MSDHEEARAQLLRATIQTAIDGVYRAGAVSGSCALGYDPADRRSWAQALVLRPGNVLEEITTVDHANGVEALEVLAEKIAVAVRTEPEHLPPAGLR